MTNTGTQQLALAFATAMSVTMDSRQFRPYPPAGLQVNGSAYPTSAFGTLTATWVHRDRVLQADQLLDTLDATVGPEAGTSYTAYWYLDDVLEHTETSIGGTTATHTPGADGVVRVEIESVRDSLASWQRLAHEFNYTVNEPAVRVTPTGDVRVTPTGDRRITS